MFRPLDLLKMLVTTLTLIIALPAFAVNSNITYQEDGSTSTGHYSVVTPMRTSPTRPARSTSIAPSRHAPGRGPASPRKTVRVPTSAINAGSRSGTEAKTETASVVVNAIGVTMKMAATIDALHSSGEFRMNRTHYRMNCRLAVVMSIGLTCITPGYAVGEVHDWGDSTTIVEQRGGPGSSKTRVTRQVDTQQVITRDGASTDISIQRGGRRAPATSGRGRFDREGYTARFVLPDDRFTNNPLCSRWRASRLEQAFRLRILERLGSRH